MKQTIFLAIAIILSTYTDAQVKRPGSRRVLIGGGALAQSGTPVIPKQSGSLHKTASTIPIFNLLNNYSKKIGTTTFTISKKTPDKKERISENKLVSASAEEVDPTDKHRVCRSETRRYTAETMTQEVLTPEAINNLKLGGVYSLENMQSGNYNAIYTDRLPINISLDQGTSSILVENPSETSLREALNKVKAIPFPATPTSFGSFLSTTQVTSEESLNAAANVSYSGFGFNAAYQFKYNKSSSSHKFLLTYVNPTYTAVAEPANNNRLFFKDNNLNTDQSLVYISQITYGIKLMVYFEGNVNIEDINNKLEAGGYGAKGSLETEYKNRLSKTIFKIFLYGSNETLRTVKGYDDMLANVDELLKNISIKGKKIPLELGQPLSYQLRFMDGDVAVTSCKVEDIPQKICGPNPIMPLDLEINLASYLHGGFGIDGNIKAALRIGDNEFYNTPLYSVPSQARIGRNADDITGPVSSITIPSVSKEARDNGVLRLYGIWNSNGDYYMSGVNLATGPFLKNIYYKDIPLKSILEGTPGNPVEIKMEFRGKNKVLVGADTETFFKPTITARYIYE